MVATLIIWTYILIAAYIYGWTFLNLLIRWFKVKVSPATISIPVTILVGLCGITVIASILSLFVNLGWLAQSLFVIGGILLAWRMHKQRALLRPIRRTGLSWILLILSLLVFLTVLENGTHGVANPDTGIYHAQAIRWIETYPAVPGLGNLHSRLAYNSIWLVLNAFFSFSFLGLRSFHVLPGAFLLASLAYFLGGVNKLIEGHISLASLFKLLLVPLLFFTIGSQISAPGTDFPTDVFIWIVIALFLDSLESYGQDLGKSIQVEEILVFIFSFFLITIKLSSVSILLLPAFIFIRQLGKNKNLSVKLMLLPFILLAPWFARNLILSGYWIYPLPVVAGLSPNWDWKIPLNGVTEEARSILAWARIPRANPDQVLAMPVVNWMQEWFGNLSLNRKGLVLLAAFSPVIYTIAAWLELRKGKTFKYYSLIYCISFLGVIFWLFEAPDIRFGYGILVATLLLSGIPIISWLLKKPMLQRIGTYTILAAVILYQGAVLFQSFDFKTFSDRIFLPADYNSLPTEPCNIHGRSILCAEYYDECWYSPFPCIPPGSANLNVEMRGASLRDGFRNISPP